VVVNQRRRWLLSHLNRITSQDVTIQGTVESQLILKYGARKFHIATKDYEGSVLVFPKRTYLWPVSDIKEISMDNLAPVATQSPSVEILVIGCGDTFLAPLEGLRESLSDWGVALEWMDTGAACRTYNILMAEGRCCAAALIAVD
jgi:uncharacterized protein